MNLSNHQDENIMLNEPISYKEVEFAINNLNVRKACGIDNIPNEILKNQNTRLYLYYLFYVCFQNSIVPNLWSQAIICPVPKDKSKCMFNPLNYRGISLLPCIAKLYSSILNNRLTKYCDILDIIADEQNGFRKARSCLDHIYILILEKRLIV